MTKIILAGEPSEIALFKIKFKQMQDACLDCNLPRVVGEIPAQVSDFPTNGDISGYMTLSRDERMEMFTHLYLPALSKVTSVNKHTTDSFTIDSATMGKIDFYPKSGRALIRMDNHWVDQGLDLLFNHIDY